MIAHLPNRSVLELAGPDRVAFLQGLVSNDVTLAAPGRAIWAALLTPQGKWVADFFIFAQAERLLLDVEAAQRDMLAQRLSRYRLRSAVAIAPVDLHVYAGWGDAPPAAAAIAAPDPRLDRAGWRMLAAALPTDATDADYDAHRLRLGLPDGSRDLDERSVLLEAGFDRFNGISWTKGCYMGQELTARTRYRGLLKRHLVRVEGETLPPPGTVLTQNGVEIGTMRSSQGDVGLALIRVGVAGELASGECRLRVAEALAEAR